MLSLLSFSMPSIISTSSIQSPPRRCIGSSGVMLSWRHVSPSTKMKKTPIIRVRGRIWNSQRGIHASSPASVSVSSPANLFRSLLVVMTKMHRSKLLLRCSFPPPLYHSFGVEIRKKSSCPSRRLSVSVRFSFVDLLLTLRRVCVCEKEKYRRHCYCYCCSNAVYLALYFERF